MLKRQVPERLAATEAVHLVCLIETSGGDDQVELRVDRLSQLIDEAARRRFINDIVDMIFSGLLPR
jgi:hypothetical protein